MHNDILNKPNKTTSTLPEKKFRDASDYKGGDKLKEFLARSKGTQDFIAKVIPSSTSINI